MIRLTIPEIGDEEIQAVIKVLQTGFLVQGEHVQDFEGWVAGYIGVDNAVAVSSGTAALHLALLAAGIGPGDEVIVPDFTFPATANVVELVGARPVFVDIDLKTFNIATEQIRLAINSRTRAILPVHLFGLPADMLPILQISREFGLLVIEDAACALGAEYQGVKCGNIGLAGCFSFHPRKAITTGEGGMVVTHDAGLAEKVRQLRNHGMRPSNGVNHFEMAGFNYRMTDFQGALGVAQMKRLEDILAKRSKLAAAYHLALEHTPRITLPDSVEGSRHIWQSYVVLLDSSISRDEVMRRLREEEIETTIGTYAVSIQPHFAGSSPPHPNACTAYEQSLALPLHSRLSQAELTYIVERLNAVLAEMG